MSKLRECDRHGGSFSEREEGWAEGNLVIHRRFDDGSPNDERRSVDFCRNCVNIMSGENPTPNGNVHSGDAVSAYPKQLTTSVDHGGWQPNQGYIRQMEEQNHVGESSLFDGDTGNPKPGDKVRDVVTGQIMTVLEPQPHGLACYCGVPIFQEHYHGMRPSDYGPEQPGNDYERRRAEAEDSEA
jgi:hypothetical protein